MDDQSGDRAGQRGQVLPNFKIFFPIPGFNTVDGWNFNYKVSFGTILQDTNKTRLTITPVFRYAFSRQEASGYLNFSMRNKKYRLDVQGGRFIKQFNPDEPILPIVNSFTTLFLEKNLMKIYERDYIDLSFSRKLNTNFTVHTNWSWAKRRELFNTSDFKIVNRDKIEDYTLNTPVSDELADTSFPEHNALVGSIGLTVRPWIKYTIRNDRQFEVPNSSPIITLNYRKGFYAIANSAVDFDQIELGFKHGFKIGIRGNADIALSGGMFLNSDKMYFMDYKHFQGNQTPFITAAELRGGAQVHASAHLRARAHERMRVDHRAGTDPGADVHVHRRHADHASSNEGSVSNTGTARNDSYFIFCR
jgi:hypothetical protein